MDTLILENFRCFAGRHEVPLRPLTLLVGENSTGKTSFLAAAKLANEIRTVVQTPDFNQEPFLLGSYDEVVHDRGRAKRVSFFNLGFRSFACTLEGEFRDRNAQCALTAWTITSDSGLSVVANSTVAGWVLTGSDEVDHASGKLNWFTPSFFPGPLFSDFYLEFLCDYEEGIDASIRDRWDALHDALFAETEVSCASAPVRAEPKRTYDLTSDQPKPQGNHVPVLLSQIFGSHQWVRIEAPLINFSKAAGLFDKLSVKRLGNGEGGPFQIHVRLMGHSRNIIDVGYGVSQVLPVVFDAIRGPTGQLYMFQQPEVHLHPRAQAELASLFGSLVKAQHKQFLIETHSDHLIDRVRMDVRDKKNLRPEDVVILFFDRTKKNGVKIHPIFLDDRANLLDVPDTYRQFFLDEERRFWGLP
ncbi:MAG: AAA family ATPase [Planctomycetes bacterium]|nr:AAA family ATPase [Planctomycetota bacterium]